VVLELVLTLSSVHVSLSYEGNQAVLVVTDTGVGIPAADVKHVGERFYRGDQAHTRHDGSGVMLSFVKKLVEMHKGGLKVESRCATEVPPGEPRRYPLLM
jgi:signal transduction histidine kinase